MAEQSSKYEIMKMLLSSPNPPPKVISNTQGKMNKEKNYDSDNDSGQKLYSYLEYINGQPEDINVVEMDHTYSLPWHYRPENSLAKPAKLLFMTKSQKVSCVTAGETVIDPMEVKPPPKPAYDLSKAQLLMEETSRVVSFLRPEPGDPDWDTKLEKTNWTQTQVKVFDRVMKIMHMEQLSRLANKGNWNEPVLRRISLDKCSRRFRNVLSAINWKPKITHWLHNLLLENAEVTYLTIYVDMLQTLHKKIPTLLERVLAGPVSPKINPDALKLLLKKPWDPASTALNSFKARKLPSNPLIVIVPYGCNGGTDNSPRVQRWLPYLSCLGTVIPVNTNTSSKITVVTSLEHMMSAVRAKIAEVRSDYGGRPIILLGLNSGSSLACQVALIEQVSAVVCLGFPVNTVEEKRGQPDDNILALNTPVIFVIGQHAAQSFIDDMEEIRERLKVESGLVVVGSADDQLRISKSKQKTEGLTQTMLDRCIVDEVAEFVGHVLSAPRQTPGATRQITENHSKFRVIEKKRKISIQEDIYPRKQLIHRVVPQQGGITLNVTTNRRGIGRGRGRARYITQSGGVAISRRGGMTDKGVTRPVIENISVMNTSNMDHPSLSGETSFKILPQIKVLGSEGFTKIEGGESFPIDQLTPDRLLEMPVIIAPDGQEVAHESQIKVVMGGGEGDKPVQKMTLNRAGDSKGGEVKCTTIYFRKRGATYHGTRISTVNMTSRQTDKKPKLPHFISAPPPPADDEE